MFSRSAAKPMKSWEVIPYVFPGLCMCPHCICIPTTFPPDHLHNRNPTSRPPQNLEEKKGMFWQSAYRDPRHSERPIVSTRHVSPFDLVKNAVASLRITHPEYRSSRFPCFHSSSAQRTFPPSTTVHQRRNRLLRLRQHTNPSRACHGSCRP